MAEEVGVAYLSISPSLRNFKGDLEKQLTPQLADTGQTAGTQLGQGMSAGISRSAVAARAAGAQVGAAATQGATAAASTGGVRLRDVFSEFFRAPVQTIREFSRGAGQELDAIGGKSVALKNLGRNALAGASGLKTLAAKSTGLQAVRSAAAGAVGSLGGISSLLGAAGPWGIALAGAGLALNGFMQAQANAQAATDAFTGSLNEQTGALTQKSLEQIGVALQGDITHADEWRKLNEMGFGLQTTITVLAQGGQALDDYLAKLKAVGALQGPNAYLARNLATSIGNQTEVMVDATDKARANAAGLAAVKGAADALGISTQAVTDATNRAANALKAHASEAIRDASALTQVGGQLIQVESSFENVTAAINSTPKNVSISASGIGFDALLNQIQAVQSALSMLKYGVDTTSSTYAGGDHIGLLADRQSAAAKAAQKSYDDAYAKVKKTFDKINTHNAGVKTKTSESRGASAASAASVDSARQKAREALAEAQQSLKANITTRISSVAGAVTPNITALPKTAPGIRRALERALQSIKKFRANINALAKRGLPKVFLQQLLDAGLDGAATAQALMSSSGKDFAAIKDLSQRIQKQSTGLGRDSIGNIFGEGQNAIKLLVNGMDSQQQLVDKQATKVARTFSRAFARQYGGPSVPRAPRAHTAKKSGNGGPIVHGDLVIVNPKPQTVGESATTGLRKAAFLIGAA